MRLPNDAPPDVLGQLALTEYFFHGKRFQRWAMVYCDTGFNSGDWTHYKWLLNPFVHGYNGNDVDLRKKLKKPSLGHVILTLPAGRCLAVTNDGGLFRQPLDTSLKRQRIGPIRVTFDSKREAPLWNTIESSKSSGE